MENFDVSKSSISAEDMLDGVDFINEFVGELAEFPNRLTGTENETACARSIRNRLHDESSVKTRLEAYYAYPLLGRGALPFLGIWYMVSLVLYFVSFAGGRVAGALLTALALAVFVSGSVAIISLFLGRSTLAGLLNKKPSYNVVSEFSKSDAGAQDKRTFVIVDNHDAKLGGFFGDFGVLRKLTILIAPISAGLFVLFCILKMAIGTESVSTITVFTILPAIFGLLGAFATFTHYSPFVRHARQNNGVATAIAMATYAYFVEHDDKIPDDAKIVYVSLGGENSAHGGSQAFVRSHPELAGAQVLCVQDVLSGDLKIAECDALRKIAFSTPLVSVVRSSAHEQGIEISTVPHDTIRQKFASLHGYTSDAFANSGMATATITANAPTDRVLDRNDVEKLFSLTVGALEKLMAEEKKPPKQEEIVAKSTDMEIKDAVGK
ncbi:MAG: hypothetical protein IK048_05770 [Clostridia bacterium]|nr:hypothetical protein [Clostridia bacterium]